MATEITKTALALETLIQEKFNQKTHTLELSNHDLEEQGGDVVKLCEILQGNPEKYAEITTLELSHQDSEAVQAIAKLVEVNKTLKHLVLSFIHINLRSCQAMAKALKANTTLETLAITESDMDDKGCKEIAAALRENASLKVLDLEDNEITEEGCVAIADILSGTKTPEGPYRSRYIPRDVTYDDSDSEDDEEATANTSLQSVNLTNNSIGDDGARELVDATDKIKKEDINHNLAEIFITGHEVAQAKIDANLAHNKPKSKATDTESKEFAEQAEKNAVSTRKMKP